MNPCTSSLFAPLNVNNSNGCISVRDSSASFRWVTAVPKSGDGNDLLKSIFQISLGASAEARENHRYWPRQTMSPAEKSPQKIGRARCAEFAASRYK